jgi:hypothetical protein
MSVDDHNILIPFASELICQRQSEDACANDDNPVAWADHGSNLVVNLLVSSHPEITRDRGYKYLLCSRENRTIIWNSFAPYLLISDKRLALLT